MRLRPFASTALLLLLACTPARDRGDDGDTTAPPAGCGDGQLGATEACDPSVSVGVGACPESCDDAIACTTDTEKGEARLCSLVCTHAPVTTCRAGDGCCPAGCSAADDADCNPPATCGNDRVDEGETCDGDCPSSCRAGASCTTAILVGNRLTCSATCVTQPIATCTNGDACCPQGCTATNDSDCREADPVCGNGKVERGELCDGNCPSQCPSTGTCKVGRLVGTAGSCNAQCVSDDVVQCRAGDGCCPAGCSNANDTDCECVSRSCDERGVECGDSVDDCGRQVTCGGCGAGGGCWENHCWRADRSTGTLCDSGADCAGNYCWTEAETGFAGGYCTKGCGAGSACDSAGKCLAFSGSTTGSCYRTCTVDEDCGPGQICQSFSNGAYQVCFAGGTGARLPGDACTNHAQCAGGYATTCQIPTGEWPDGYCLRRCSSHNQCGSAHHCTSLTWHEQTINGCTRDCTSDTQCREGYACGDGDGDGKRECLPR